MNAQEIKEQLLKELPIGSNYDIWEVGRKAQRIVEIATGKHLSYLDKKHEITITYQSLNVVKIKVQRKRGKYKHFIPYSNSYDWTISGYEVEVIMYDSVEERIEKIKNYLISKENKRVDEINKNVEFTKRLMSLGLTLEEIEKYVRYMDSWTNRHEVFGRIKGEIK